MKNSDNNPKVIKRRETSVKRAALMHTARMQNSLPETRAPNTTGIHIGCSGWFYWHWWGKFYPKKMQPKNWFRHYQKSFDTVELNAPFYTWPTIATVKTWLRQAKKENFLYTVKIPELITHVKLFKNTKTLIKDFQLVQHILAEHMGCFLFQFPPSYSYSPARLKNIASQLNADVKNVIEFRHESWWNDKVFSAFEKGNIIFCSVSSPKLPDELIKTADDIYVRFHGKAKMYRHDYTLEDLQIWAERIDKSKAAGKWIYFNNDFEANAIKNARQLMGLLSSGG